MKAAVSAAMRVERRVARISNPGHGGTGYAHSRRQLLDLIRINLQAACLHLDAPKIEFINEGIGFGEVATRPIEVLGPTQAGLQFGGHIGAHVQAVGVAAGEGQPKVRIALEVRILEEQIDLLLQQAIVAAQGDGLFAAEEVVAGEIRQGYVGSPRSCRSGCR